ncbi:LptA/OstA family protein [Kiritimatiellaeota bacterium B1221]|nr:LptA/OstA family protein [Kiritimatiellaeota bacterium B1221]
MSSLLQMPLRAQAAKAVEERITEITSDKLFFDYEGKKAIFTGNVVVTDPDLQLTGDKLVVTMTADDEIEKLEAEGNVEIKMEGLHSRSGKAEYLLTESKVILTEGPQVSREGSVMTADKVIYWRLENRMETVGKTRVIMFSEGKQ